MPRVWGPPSRCARCGEYGRLVEEPQPSCDACGSALEPRPFVDTDLRVPGDLAALPLIPSPGMLAVPRICGTAMLTIARIAELARFAERCVIVARRDREGVLVSITAPPEHAPDPAVHASTRITFPVHLGVGVRSEGEPHRAAAAFVTLEAAGRATARLVHVASGAPLVVVLYYADALYEARVAPA